MTRRHTSLIRLALAVLLIQAAAALPGSATPASAQQSGGQIVTVGLNKSSVVDLPGDLGEIVISDPSIISAVVRNTRSVHLLGQKIGQATASFIGRDGAPMLTLSIAVERDLAPVAALIGRMLPAANVKLEAINDNIVVTGSVASPLDAARITDIAGRFVANTDRVLNMVEVEAREQVLLQVRVVEMNRTATRRLGVDIGGSYSSGNISIVKLTEAAFPLTGAAIPPAAFGTVTEALSGSGAGQLFGLGWGNGTGRIDAVIQALETNGMARILAEPNLTSVSGENARFLAGGEYPVPVGNDDNGTQILFKPFGVSLSFTPIVLSAGRISLRIETEVSELSNDGAVVVNEISIPALRVRRASSVLEMPSGGSLVMAGLISSQTRRNIEGLPGLQDLPVIGPLFTSREFIRSETELVVIVTPLLVRHAEQNLLASPGEDLPGAGAEYGQRYGFIIE
jgi:pilus assembly protein CpaC